MYILQSSFQSVTQASVGSHYNVHSKIVPTQPPYLCESPALIERVPKDVIYLVPVQHSHPLAPGVRAGPLGGRVSYHPHIMIMLVVNN